MARNPFKDSTEKTRRASANSFLDLGVVRDVDDNADHVVLVEILSTGGQGGPVVAAALVPQLGDINVPEVGTLVVVGRVKGRRPVVLGSLYSTDSDVPTYQSGDRRIGHDSTQAQFKIDEDGTVRIDSDSGNPVLINGSEPSTETDRVDVSDNGALVVEDVGDINFSTDLLVTDDGDGTVTVDVNRYTDEESQDAVGTILSADFTYDDATPAINMNPHSTDANAHHADPSAGTGIVDEGTNQFGLNIVASGQVTLSSGVGVVDTGISAVDATLAPLIGVDDPDVDTKIAARLFWDDSVGTYHVEFVEQETSVGNPTVNYDIIRAR